MKIGDQIGRYRIEARLRAGGMATLYLARVEGASGFSRFVAIKVVHEHLTEDPTFTNMFIDEAILSSKIHHPNVVHVEELGEHEDRHYLVMEYVHGCTLQQLMRGLMVKMRTMTPSFAVWFAAKVLEGLHAAHETKDEAGQELGVVHRDVSPHNILLAYEGHVKLIDFGIAKARGRLQATVGEGLKGKLAYMAPEQAVAGEVDARTDVYALGICLWEMLTLRRLFKGSNEAELVAKVRFPEVIPPSEWREEITPELDEVVMKALAKQPGERYQSAQEFRRALLRAVPDAAILDATDCRALVQEVLAEQIHKDNASLPKSVREVIGEMVTLTGDAHRTVAERVLRDLPADEPSREGDDLWGASAPTVSASPSAELSRQADEDSATEVTQRRETTGRMVMAFVVALLVGVGGTYALGLWGEEPEPIEEARSGVESDEVLAAPESEPEAPALNVERDAMVDALPEASSGPEATVETPRPPQNVRGPVRRPQGAGSRPTTPMGGASATVRPAMQPAPPPSMPEMSASMLPSMTPTTSMGLLTDFE